MDYIIKDGELYHHGILGMKWGVRRYQNKDGSLTQAGKKRISRKQKKALEKARKTRRENLEKAKKAKQEQEDFEKNKKKAIESGTATEVMKYKGKLTNQELQQAVSRINMERQLAEISSKEIKTGMDKINSFMGKVDQMRANVEKGISSYNTMAKILNSTTDSDLPIIDGNKKRDKAIDKAKKKLVKSGSIKEIEKNLGKFDNEEIKAINTRLAFEKNIKNMVKESEAKSSSKTSESKSTSNDKQSTIAEKYNLKKSAKRDISDISNATWVKKESDRILKEIKNDRVSNYGHRQDVVDAINRYIEELDD